MADYVIETQGLTKQYGPITPLDNLSLTVPRHAIFGFLGPNGAGKTTVMRLSLLILQFTPWALGNLVVLPMMGPGCRRLPLPC